MRPQTIRFAIAAGIVALMLVCLTLLAALEVVPGERVLDILAAAVPAACGGWLGARNGNGNGRSLRPPVPAPYPPERP